MLHQERASSFQDVDEYADINLIIRKNQEQQLNNIEIVCTAKQSIFFTAKKILPESKILSELALPETICGGLDNLNKIDELIQLGNKNCAKTNLDDIEIMIEAKNNLKNSFIKTVDICVLEKLSNKIVDDVFKYAKENLVKNKDHHFVLIRNNPLWFASEEYQNKLKTDMSKIILTYLKGKQSDDIIFSQPSLDKIPKVMFDIFCADAGEQMAGSAFTLGCIGIFANKITPDYIFKKLALVESSVHLKEAEDEYIFIQAENEQLLAAHHQ